MRFGNETAALPLRGDLTHSFVCPLAIAVKLTYARLRAAMMQRPGCNASAYSTRDQLLLLQITAGILPLRHTDVKNAPNPSRTSVAGYHRRKPVLKLSTSTMPSPAE